MSRWGNIDNAANSCLHAAAQLNLPANTVNQTALYGNTTTGAFHTNEVNGQFGIDAVEAANTAADTKKVTHAGWNLKTTGTGSVLSLAITAGGTGYANTDTLRFTAAGTSTVNATATLSTNTAGGITAVTLTNAGKGFTNTTVFAAFANSTGGVSAGTSANVAASVGGRAGRVAFETLVAMGSIS